MNKKAQSQIITTVLIILLVLAAIVIVWQVVNTTVRGGGKEIESQSKCIGFTVTIGNLVAGQKAAVYANKDVEKLIIYKNGQKETESAGALTAGIPLPTVGNVVSTDVITASGIIAGTLCDGKDSKTVP